MLVGPGSVCIVNATVSGSVQTRPGTALYVADSSVNGSIGENGGVAFAMCGSDVGGSVLITRTSGSVLVGDGGDDGTFACTGSTIGATLSIGRTTGHVEVGGAQVGGSLSLLDTTSTGVPPEGVPELEANVVHSSLLCLRNDPAPVNDGQPNTVGGVRSGQCTLL